MKLSKILYDKFINLLAKSFATYVTPQIIGLVVSIVLHLNITLFYTHIYACFLCKGVLFFHGYFGYQLLHLDDMAQNYHLNPAFKQIICVGI